MLLAEAVQTKQCRNCKASVYTPLLNRDGVCQVCESGAQYLQNALYHIHSEFKERLVDMLFNEEQPVYEISGVYSAQDRILNILQREFGEVYRHNERNS